MPELDELYQAIILEHNKRPRHYGPLEAATHQAEGYNPLCGDRVTVQLSLREGRIDALRFESASCAICRASASLMAEALQGAPAETAASLGSRVDALLGPDGPEPVESDGELAALAGVRRFPARVKCARLPWQTLRDALGRDDA